MTNAHIVYIDPNVFFTMLKKDTFDDLTQQHLQAIIADSSVCIKIPAHHYMYIQQLKTNHTQRKELLSRATLKLIDYFLDKRIFTFAKAQDANPYDEFIRLILQDLQEGHCVSLISNNSEANAIITAKIRANNLNTHNFSIIGSKELKLWLERNAKKP